MGRKGPIAKPVTLGEEIQKFELLLTRLRAHSVLSQQNEILTLFLHLSGDAKNGSTSASNIVGNVFANKSMNKLDYVGAK